MNNNLITLLMGSQYLIAGQETLGKRFDIGEANPSSIFERMVNNHLSNIIDFLKGTYPFNYDLAYRKICKLQSIGFVAYYLIDMGNVLFLNTSRYCSSISEYLVYLPDKLDNYQKRHIYKLLEENKDAKFSVLFNLKIGEDGIPTGDSHNDISSEDFLKIL